MPPFRIVVVGAGSQRSLGLIASFAHAARGPLGGADVVLLDVNDEHLPVIENYARRLANGIGADIQFTPTTDQRAALKGADYILTTFRPGSFDQLEQDERIPPKHGLQGNETVGIGGIFMACRVAPIMRSILDDAAEVCPSATVINYTNPTQYVADIVHRLSDFPVISLCDGHLDIYEDLAKLFGVDRRDIEFTVAGTNHAMWVTQFTVNGEAGYPLLRQRLAELDEDELVELFSSPPMVKISRDWAAQPREVTYPQLIPHNKFEFDLKLFGIYGLLPAPRYYWRYLLEQDEVLRGQIDGTHVSMSSFYRIAERTVLDDMEAKLADDIATLSQRATAADGFYSHGDIAVRVLSAIVADEPRRFAVNVRNGDAISNLPEDAIVEVTALVDRRGAHPLAVGKLPEPLLPMQLALAATQKLAVQAAISGDRTTLLAAIATHPNTHSLSAAEECMEEMLDVQSHFLPQFAAPVED
jgi:6-phospho-beta-glucosidase